MAVSYGLDLSQIKLDEFCTLLKEQDLLPSRVILRDNLDLYFDKLQTAGLFTMQDLVNQLSTKKKVETFSQTTGIPVDYLTILRRQARSYLASPIYLKEIPGINSQTVQKLAQIGINNSQHLFDRCLTPNQRIELANELQVPIEEINELAQLSDLVRAGWVGPIFVRLLHSTGIHSIKELAESDAADLYQRTLQVNQENKLTKAGYSQKDVLACIETAKKLPDRLLVD
ncbi:MAG: hypothetical protein CL609_17825 [Anaerolineaceae bacterium]|nr:hypothetical protein [Anaerolineaceae bacterium]